MSRTALWILTIVFLPIAGVMGLVTYTEWSAGRALQAGFYVILISVWYIFLVLLFSASTTATSLPNRVMLYPVRLASRGLASINPRIYTSVLVLGVLALLGYWAFVLPVDYFVLSVNDVCKPGTAKPATLWPGVFTLLVGLVSLNHAVYGKAYLFYRDRDATGDNTPAEQRRRWIKYTVIMMAILLSGIALYRLGSFSLFRTTVVDGAKFTGYLLLYLGILLAFIYMMGAIFNIKQKRINKIVMSDLAKIPMQERTAIVDSIDRQARTQEYSLLHRCFISPANEQDLILTSHFGGTPYLEHLDEFPHLAEQSQKRTSFLLQLKLSAQRLGNVWQGRLITVYLDDWTLTVRSYVNPVIEKRAIIPGYQPAYCCLTFSPLAIPFVPEPTDDAGNDEDTASGCELGSIIKNTPGLKEQLEKYSRYEILLLTRLIDPYLKYDHLDIDHMILEGGDPVIIQNPHDARCPVCQKRMRFLFQFGEVSAELELGDTGQGYVYGCDDHPECCEGFIDCC